MTSYSGKIIRKTPVTPTQTSASGVWTTADAAAAVKNNLWPVPGVPDPISRSVRLRSSASAYFNRTNVASPTNPIKWTWSGWFKRGVLPSTSNLFSATNSGSDDSYVLFSNDTLVLGSYQGAGTDYGIKTSAVLRDPSAWYHIVAVLDTANATAADRAILYINGVRQTVSNQSNGTFPQNYTGCKINAASQAARMGLRGVLNDGPLDGYLAEINFVDGQALTPSSFGTTNAFTGAWIPMPYTGTYGTNGFYLNFKDNTSTTTLGYDYSGNSNNWTANNISLTAGTTYDSMLDSPTNWVGYSATTDTSAVTRGNFAVLNPLDTGSNGTVSAGNLTHTSSGGITRSNATIRIPSSGKFYAEFVNSSATNASIGIGFGVSADSVSLSGNSSAANSYHFYASANGYAVNNGSLTAISSWTNSANQTFQLAVDVDNGKVWIGQNNVWWNSAGGSTGNPSTGANPTFTIATSGFKVFTYLDPTGSVNWQATFGQRPFTYTPPTGFSTLCTTNLPVPTIVNGASYMAASTYSGTGAIQSIVNSGNNTTSTTFQPDFLWIKCRSSTAFHVLVDSVRGLPKVLSSNATDAEAANGFVTSLNSNGFTLPANTTSDAYYTNIGSPANTFVGWQWKAGGAAVSNTNGTITSSVSANTTAGFSVVTYTGTGSNATVGHGLGAAPSMVIVKLRSGAGENWNVWHTSLASTTYRILLNTTGAVDTTSPTVWSSGGINPTSTTFTVGTSTGTNGSASTYVAYCFAAVRGYSAFGSYTGNGSTDGPFVYLGFRPRWLMIKRSSSASVTYGWQIYDTSRQPVNTAASDPNLWADTSAAEGTGNYTFDLLSNGFKLRSSGVNENASGDTYIYAAFAELPFNYSNAR